MIVINKDKSNLIFSGEKENNVTLLLRNINTNSWIAILINVWSYKNKRENVFTITESSNTFDVPFTDEYPLDILNTESIYIYNVIDSLGNINMSLNVGTYDAWLFYSPYNDIKNDVNQLEVYKLFLKDNIKTINRLTNDDDYSLYLKYNPTIVLVRE